MSSTQSLSDHTMLKKMADTVRFLAVDMIEQANSGHPGAPMGLADIVTVLSHHLCHNPHNPKWLNRDRIVFSGGHGSAMIYSLLHLWGYDVSLEDLKQFRQLGSKTPGHPEYGYTDGIEITTGPLGQGVANAVGFAMAAKYAGHLLNDSETQLITHKTYCLCGDGDLQEGISYEACSLAGHLGLNNLVMIYDSNNITIEGELGRAFSENIPMRFAAQGWDTVEIDGHDYAAIDQALKDSANQTKPLLIIAKTEIARGSRCAGSASTHGAPLGAEEVRAAKEMAGFDPEQSFVVPEDVKLRFRCALEQGELAEKEWLATLESADESKKSLLIKLQNPDISALDFPGFAKGDKVATRDSNGKILNALATQLPGFIGGSADLAPSNKTELKELGDFPHGKNIRFGIREHAMGAITNAIGLYGLFIPFSATFFVFSDYMTPSCRIAALSKIRHFFVWTHDSIGVGEDGATHQPVEHISQARALPQFYVFRPSDALENIACWQAAFSLHYPCGFVLSRQKLTVLDLPQLQGSIAQGGYLAHEAANAKITLVATGSEVELAHAACEQLNAEGIATNLVSIPCFDLFIEQDQALIDSVISPTTKVLAIEAATDDEWYRFADKVIGMSTYGESGPGGQLFKHFGFTVDNIIQQAKTLL